MSVPTLSEEVVEIEGASHAARVSHPDETADTILRARGRRVGRPTSASDLMFEGFRLSTIDTEQASIAT